MVLDNDRIIVNGSDVQAVVVLFKASKIFRGFVVFAGFRVPNFVYSSINVTLPHVVSSAEDSSRKITDEEVEDVSMEALFKISSTEAPSVGDEVVNVLCMPDMDDLTCSVVGLNEVNSEL